MGHEYDAIDCPKCSGPLTADPNFVQWCPRCDWNVDPSKPPPVGRWRRRTQRQSDRLARTLYEDVRAHPGSQTGGRPTRLTVLGLATTVHAVTLALLGLAVWVAVAADGSRWWRIGAALLLGGVVYFVQPIPRRRGRRDPVKLGPSEAPNLFRLLDDVAGELGAPTVEAVVVDASFNAFYSRIKGKRTVGIGLTLWATLSGPQKVALLGHELGHSVNGDLRRLRLVSRALVSLARWQQLFQPVHFVRRGHRAGLISALVDFAERFLVALILVPLVLVIGGFGGALRILSYRQGQRSEYYADELAARVAGTEAAVGLTEQLLTADVCTLALTRAVRFAHDPDPWARVREASGAVPATERERQRRLARQRLNRIDVSHPPTQMRADLLVSRPERPPTVRLDPERERAVDAEVFQAAHHVLRQVQDGLGVTTSR